MSGKIRLWVAVLLVAAGAGFVGWLLPSGAAAAGRPGLPGGAFDCGDTAGPGWRCFVVDADQLAPALEDLDTGGCLTTETIGVAPWRHGPQLAGTSFVTHFVVYGYRDPTKPCFP